jgi:hypothetical protein
VALSTEDRVFERIFLPIVKYRIENKEAKASEAPKAFGAENERGYSILSSIRKIYA